MCAVKDPLFQQVEVLPRQRSSRPSTTELSPPPSPWFRSSRSGNGRGGTEYLAHYHVERNHQLGNELIDGDADELRTGEVVRHECLGGLLNFYERAA